MLARKHKMQMCALSLSNASRGVLRSVAMRETLCAEIDLTEAVVDLVTWCDKTVSLDHLQG